MYKIEDFVYDLVADMKANLTPFITAINTAKGDSLLSAFEDESYSIQTLDDKVMNYKKFIIVQVGNPAINGTERGGFALTYPIAVYMSFDQSLTDGDSAKLLFRYNDALFSYTLDRFWKVAQKPFKVSAVDQLALIDINKSKRVIATGLVLEATFAH